MFLLAVLRSYPGATSDKEVGIIGGKEGAITCRDEQGGMEHALILGKTCMAVRLIDVSSCKDAKSESNFSRRKGRLFLYDCCFMFFITI